MIDGNEPINAIVETNSIEGHEFLDCNHTGITLKQHMVIEFTKCYTITGRVRRISLWSRIMLFFGISGYTVDNEYNSESNVKVAIELANEVIKQLNEE